MLASHGEGGEGPAVLDLLGSRHGWRSAKIGGGGGSACFAYVAWLALVGNGGVLGVVHWQRMSEHQRWCVGGMMALSQCWRQHADVRGGGTRQST